MTQWTESSSRAVVGAPTTAALDMSQNSLPAPDPLTRLRQKDGRIFLLNAQLEKKNKALVEHDLHLKSLTQELQRKDEAIAALRDDLTRFQGKYRTADGRVCLLRYQLERARGGDGDAAQSFPLYLLHAARFNAVLTQLRARSHNTLQLLSQRGASEAHTTHSLLLGHTHSLTHSLISLTESSQASIEDEEREGEEFDLPIAVLHKVLVEGQAVDESVLSALSHESQRERDKERERERESAHAIAASFDFISPIATRDRAAREREGERERDREAREREREREEDAALLSPAALKNLFLAFADELHVKPPLSLSLSHSHSHSHKERETEREREASTTLLDYHGSFLSDEEDALERERERDLSTYSLDATADLLARTPHRPRQAPSSSNIPPKTTFSPVFGKYEPVVISKGGTASVVAVPAKAQKTISFAAHDAPTQRALFHEPSHTHTLTEKRLLLSQREALRETERERESVSIFARHRVESVAAPATTTMFSPLSFADNLARIRSQNDRLRSDISRFKGKLDLMKQECATIRTNTEHSVFSHRAIMS